MLKSIILSHSGKQHAYQVANALNNLGYLKHFYTSSYVRSKALQQLSLRLNDQFFQRRFLTGLHGQQIKPAWKYELLEFIVRKARGNNAGTKQLVMQRDNKFDADLAIRLKKLSYQVYWGFQGSCLHSIRAAKRAGKLTICEMTTTHIATANSMLQQEAQLLPEWADLLDFYSFPKQYEDRLVAEPHEAHRVIALSNFLKTSLVQNGVPAEKIDVIPLGFDHTRITFGPAKSLRNRSLKLLFVGSITARKGVYYLLKAIEHFSKKDVELHFIGHPVGSGQAFKSYSHLYSYQPGISQNEVYKLYSQYDVLVFPSLLEGFGLVALEAMGAGLPVIMTPNTSAAEILDDGKNGFIVPIRAVAALVAAIEKFRNMDDAVFEQMRMAARQKAEQFTWQKYQDRVADYTQKVCSL